MPIPYPPRQNHRALYKKDSLLYEQRMQFTINDISWWDTPCCYCGDPAECDDHVFPIAALEKLAAVGDIDLPEDVLRLVPACRECNALGSDMVFYAFNDKRLYIKARLAKRYLKTLQVPHWSPEEISQLEGRLKRWIGSGQEIRAITFDRLGF